MSSKSWVKTNIPKEKYFGGKDERRDKGREIDEDKKKSERKEQKITPAALMSVRWFSKTDILLHFKAFCTTWLCVYHFFAFQFFDFIFFFVTSFYSFILFFGNCLSRSFWLCVCVCVGFFPSMSVVLTHKRMPERSILLFATHKSISIWI